MLCTSATLHLEQDTCAESLKKKRNFPPCSRPSTLKCRGSVSHGWATDASSVRGHAVLIRRTVESRWIRVSFAMNIGPDDSKAAGEVPSDGVAANALGDGQDRPGATMEFLTLLVGHGVARSALAWHEESFAGTRMAPDAGPQDSSYVDVLHDQSAKGGSLHRRAAEHLAPAQA